jgi:hypothetical protein
MGRPGFVAPTVATQSLPPIWRHRGRLTAGVCHWERDDCPAGEVKSVPQHGGRDTAHAAAVEAEGGGEMRRTLWASAVYVPARLKAVIPALSIGLNSHSS